MVMFRVIFKMKLPVLAFALLMAGSAIGADEAALRADAQKVFKEKVGPFVNKYCTRCHGSRAKAGINLQSALKNPVGESASLHWKKAVANVKVHDMPPEDSSKKPTDEERRQFAEWIGKLKYLAPRDPGPFVIRRLTKAEYGNTLRDLYGVVAVGHRHPAGRGGGRRVSQFHFSAAVGAVSRGGQQGGRAGHGAGWPSAHGGSETALWRDAARGRGSPQGGAASGAFLGARCVSAAAHREGVGRAGGHLRAGTGKQAGLHGVAGADVEGGPGFATISLYHAGRRSGLKGSHRAAGQFPTGCPAFLSAVVRAAGR